MRIKTLLSLAALALCAPAAESSAQVNVTVNLGPPQPVALYTTEQFGPWRTSYQGWQPTTLYVINGRYYERQAAGARTVVVYRRNNAYFFPPQEVAWIGVDKRYDYKHKPWKDDYNNGRGRGRGRGNGKP